eukprot:gene36517-44299_t
MEVLTNSLSFLHMNQGGQGHTPTNMTLPMEAEMEALIIALHQELDQVRNDNVLQDFKLREAKVQYERMMEKYSICFHPCIALNQAEMYLVNWILCPSYQLTKNISILCEEAVRCASNCIKQMKPHMHCEAYLVYSLELKVTRCELLIIQAFVELNKKNIMSAAHSLVQVYQQYKKLSGVLKDCEEKVNLKTRFSLFCQSALTSPNTIDLHKIDGDLIKALAESIEQKSQDIRKMHADRHSLVPEKVLEATRELLQLKQLYKDLSGQWKSSDGHKECKVQQGEEREESSCTTRAGVGFRTPEKTAPTTASDMDDEHEQENDLIRSAVKSYSPLKQGQGGEKVVPLTVFSPPKPPLPTVRVLLPRLSDITKLFENKVQIDGALKPRDEGGLGAAGAKKKTTVGKAPKAPQPAPKSLAQTAQQPNPAAPAPPVDSFLPDSKPLADSLAEAGEHFLLRLLAQLRGRLLFANALYCIGGSLIPPHMTWIANILNLQGDLIKGVGVLYMLHESGDCLYSPLSTLLLLNLPPPLIEDAFSNATAKTDKGYPIPGRDVSQFYAVLQAQSYMLPWGGAQGSRAAGTKRGGHPLWLLSLTHSDQFRTNEISANIHTKLDHYRRVLKVEDQLLSGGVCSWVRYQMIRHFLSLGHYMQAISACRELLQHLRGFDGEGEGALGKAVVMCLVAASAALVTNEQFASQTRYLQLKFDERIVLNPSASVTSAKLGVGNSKASFTALQGTSVFDKH